jgi:hypothetical protein
MEDDGWWMVEGGKVEGGWQSVKPARLLRNGYFKVPRRDMRKVFFRAPTSGSHLRVRRGRIAATAHRE